MVFLESKFLVPSRLGAHPKKTAIVVQLLPSLSCKVTNSPPKAPLSLCSALLRLLRSHNFPANAGLIKFPKAAQARADCRCTRLVIFEAERLSGLLLRRSGAVCVAKWGCGIVFGVCNGKGGVGRGRGLGVIDKV
jgi:hypothetical protein